MEKNEARDGKRVVVLGTQTLGARKGRRKVDCEEEGVRVVMDGCCKMRVGQVRTATSNLVTAKHAIKAQCALQCKCKAG